MRKEYQDRWNASLVNKPVYYTPYKYAVIIENQVNESKLTYGQYNTFHEASQALIYLKSVNHVDTCYIDELFFKSGLNK